MYNYDCKSSNIQSCEHFLRAPDSIGNDSLTHEHYSDLTLVAFCSKCLKRPPQQITKRHSTALGIYIHSNGAQLTKRTQMLTAWLRIVQMLKGPVSQHALKPLLA
jgi:hypothetical protein